MPRCSFCSEQYEFPNGLTLVLPDGKILYFCSSKCRKNHELGRIGWKTKWIKKKKTGKLKEREEIRKQAEEEKEKEIEKEIDKEAEKQAEQEEQKKEKAEEKPKEEAKKTEEKKQEAKKKEENK